MSCGRSSLKAEKSKCAAGSKTNTVYHGKLWQIIPTVLGEMLQDADAERLNRVTAAMLEMTKIDIAALNRAYERR